MRGMIRLVVIVSTLAVVVVGLTPSRAFAQAGAWIESRTVDGGSAGSAMTLSVSCAMVQPRPPEPNIHREFQVREPGDLSPPIVAKPINECARAVHVSGAVPHALIEVFANGNELVGKDATWVGQGDITLTRALKIGDVITAQQTVNGVVSHRSIQPVTVTAFAPGGLGRPEVAKEIWGCGIVVPVSKLTPSTTVKVFQDGQLVGQGSATGDWLPVVTQALTAGKGVTAQQVACEGDPARRIESPISTPPVVVGTAPNPPPAPIVDANSVIPGKDTVVLSGLFTGAEGIVRDRGNIVSSGMFATAPANWWPISPPASSTSKIDAAQKLCAQSPFSPPVDPTTTLRDPVLLGPMCDGQQFVVIRNTMLGAYVVVFANGGIVGYGGGTGGQLTLGLGRKLRANPQDHVTVRQYYGTLISSPSNVVDVTGGIGSPSIAIEGGEPFFIAEPGEQQIDGPVFPRGSGPGPLFNIQTCCTEGVRAEVLGPDNAVVTELNLDEVFPGYYSGTWNWSSRAGGSVPGGIPIGAYTVRVTTGCHQEPGNAHFYVIFDPAEVNGPPRFSFEETAVWFYSPPNKTMALSYALHPDDMRIFSRAIDAAKSETSALSAAKKMAIAEFGMFDYSISKSDVDTLELLDQTLAQCADDAAMLTALLRAIGIPSHPVTADAAPETGAMNWSFDTWTEFLVPGSSGPEWKVVHNHWLNIADIQGPMDRNPFGHNVGVATKTTDDIIVMAGPNWVWSDLNSGSNPAVTFTRQGCGEPSQQLNAKPWVMELCEAGYWNPDTHWSCPGGMGASSLRITLGPDVRTDYRRRIVSGSIVVINDLREPARGRYALEFAADVPETKVFPDRVIAKRELTLSVAAGTRHSLRFEFPLREDLQPGETLHLRLMYGEKVLSSIELPDTAAVVIEAERAKDLRLGVEDSLELTVRNRSQAPVHGIQVRLVAPRQVRVRTAEQTRETLAPGEAMRLRFPLTGIAPLEAGALIVTVKTSDGGAVKYRVPFRVRGAEAVETPRRSVKGR